MSHRTIYEDIRSVISLLESASGPMRFVKRDGPTTAPSGPDHALASLSAAQASEKGLLTSGTFGHTGSTSSRSAALATSLENRLRAKTDGLGSTLYKLTWKHWDLPSGRQICALRASVRRTSGKDSGSMGVVRRPRALWRETTSLSPGRASDDRPQGRLPGWQDTQRQMVNGSAGRDSATQRMVDSNDTGRSEGCERPEAVGQGRSVVAANGTQRMADDQLQQRQGGATSDNEARGRDEEPATLAATMDGTRADEPTTRSGTDGRRRTCGQPGARCRK